MRVNERDLAELRTRWEELCKRADRLGIPRPELREGARGVERIAAADGIGPDRVVCWVDVEAHGGRVNLDGWRLLGTLQHIEGRTLVRTVPGQAVPRERWNADPRDCDQCHARRDRIHTYVLAHAESGRVVQLGSDCVRGYLPGMDVEALLAYTVALIEWSEAIGAAGEERDDWGRREPDRWDLAGLLEMTARVIRVDGWVSRRQAEERGGAATADGVLLALGGPGKDDSRELRAWFRKVEEARQEGDEGEAGRAILWALSQGEASDYGHNLATIASLGWADRRMLGLACSMLPAYRRAHEREVEEARTARESQHVGTVGKRETFRGLKVDSVRYFEGDYGTRALVTFRDACSNVLAWWTSADSATVDVRELEEHAGNGRRYDVKATVKSHDRYKGTAQTMLSRCAVSAV